jgi:translation initiation factor IF-2
MDLASKNKVFTKTYDIIYRLVEEVTDAISMLMDPGEVEEEMGSAEIKAIFTLSDGSKVIGCRGIEGTVKRGEKCYIVRKDDIVAEGKILSMKHSKSDIKEAGKGDEFGVIMNSSAIDITEGDTLYCFKIVK